MDGKASPPHVAINVPSAEAKPPLPGGGGCRWSDLNELFFKGPELVKVFAQISFAAFLVLMIAFLTNLVDERKKLLHSDSISAISLLLGLGHINCIAAIFLHKLNWTKTSAVAGLTATAFVTVTIPIAATVILPAVHGVVIWIGYGLLVLICAAFLWPFPATPPAAAELPKEDGDGIPPSPSAPDDQEELDLASLSARSLMDRPASSINYQLGEITSEEDETLASLTTTVSQSIATVPLCISKIVNLQSEDVKFAEEYIIPSPQSLINLPASSINYQLGEITSDEDETLTDMTMSKEIVKLQSEDVKAEETIPEDLDLASLSARSLVDIDYQLGEITSDEGEAQTAMTMTVSKETVKLQSEDVKAEESKIAAVVCFVIGSNPRPWEMVGFLKRVWGRHGISSISVLPNRVFVVEFFDYSNAVEVADYRNLMFDGKPVFTKLWEPNLIITSDNKEEMIPAEYTVPIWINFLGIESKYLNPRCLKKLAGLVGNPLKVKISRWFNSGRVLVEVNLNQQLPDMVHFEDEEGHMWEQILAYPWKPVVCESCKRFGHTIVDCRKRSGVEKTKMMWVVKGSGPVIVAPNIDAS